MKKLFTLIMSLIGVSVFAKNSIILGSDRTDAYLPLLEGKKVALFSNHTGLTSSSLHILDVLVDNCNLTLIFSPEHGFRGGEDAGSKVSDSKDYKTNLPIYSLYGQKPSSINKEVYDSFDTLIVDIQDVGLRFYTYYITMFRLMEVCNAYNKSVIILDRPNPNGFYCDGPILEEDFVSGVGLLPIPVVHSLTLGEMALYIKAQGILSLDGLDLKVIPMEGYSHKSLYSLPLPPSPNLKSMRAIYLYPSTCLFESTLISVGRGTMYPFEVYGSPYLKSSFQFTPLSMPGATNPPYLNEVCYGRDLRDKSLKEIFKEGINLDYLIDAYKEISTSYPELCFWGRRDAKGHYWIDYLMGTDKVRLMIEEGKDSSYIKSTWSKDLKEFKNRIKPYLLYK